MFSLDLLSHSVKTELWRSSVTLLVVRVTRNPPAPLHTGSGNYIRRLVSPVQAQLDSLHGGLRDLLHMLLTQIPRLERAAGLFSSFLHLMDFISRHFLTTTQWSSSASISQFSSVNCQVTVDRKFAIIHFSSQTSQRSARLIPIQQTVPIRIEIN